MITRDDFEHRLSQGLKRWAGAGEPTLDLEAAVRTRVDAQTANPTPTESPAPVVLPRPRWFRRLLLPAAAVLVMLITAGVTFPTWAGAAAEWPLVGPVLTEIILKDAGLRWAYDNGFIQQPLAEVREGGVTVRIMALVADPGRTTIIYRVNGLPQPARSTDKPLQASGSLVRGRPLPDVVRVSIAKVDGEGTFSVSDAGKWTPVGLIGTVSTKPLPAEQAQLEVLVRIDGQETQLSLSASRAAAGKFSREVPVNETQTSGDVTVMVEAVIYTPVETIVRYRIDKPQFSGGWGGANRDGWHYLESGTTRYYTTQAARGGMQGSAETEVFAVVPAPAKFVVPSEVVGRPIDVVWALRPDESRDVAGTVVTLKSWDRVDGRIAIEWWSDGNTPYKGIADLEVIDAAGKAYPIASNAESWSQSPDGILRRTVEADLPAGVEPVAIRATSVGLAVDGPWVFELPR